MNENIGLYETLATLIGWQPIVIILLLMGGFGYWMLKRHIDILNEEKNSLQRQLSEAKENRPDVLVIQLRERYQVAVEELNRMRQDKQITQATLHSKEVEIVKIREQIEELRSQVIKANDLLQTVTDYGLVCPHCRAPLVISEGHSELVEYDGREIDVDHEYSRFECGYETMDGHGGKDCPNSRESKLGKEN